MTKQSKFNVAHFDSAKVRGSIPILEQEVNGHPLTRLDNVAESKNPNQVFYEVNPFYQKTNSNIHRGSQELGREATDMYEDGSD